MPRGVDVEHISPDGQRFVALQTPEDSAKTEAGDKLRLIFNWHTQLANATR